MPTADNAQAPFATSGAVSAFSTETSVGERVPAPEGAHIGIPLDEFIFLAQTSNPALRESAAKVAAAQGNAQQVGLAPNPTFYTGSSQWTGSISQYNWFVGQDIITAGKLRLIRSAALRSVDQAQLDLTRTRFEVLADMRRRFYVAAVARQRADVLAELLNVSAKSRDVGRKLLKAGESNQGDCDTAGD